MFLCSAHEVISIFRTTGIPDTVYQYKFKHNGWGARNKLSTVKKHLYSSSILPAGALVSDTTQRPRTLKEHHWSVLVRLCKR